VNSRYALIALGFGVYLAVAVARFPASVAYRWFAPDDISLAAVDGTIWRGSARYGGVAGLSFSDLRWELHPAALLTGKLHVTAETELASGFARAELTVSGSRLELSAVSASTDLGSFREMLPLGDVSGQVSLSLDRLEVVDGWPVSARGELRIADLSMPPLMPIAGVSTVVLGNYLARFSETDGAGIVAALSDQGGPIELTGRLSLAPDRSYEVDTLLRARADAPAHLVEGIELMTEAPNAEGMRRFRLANVL